MYNESRQLNLNIKTTMGNKHSGFASMTKEQRRKIARLGGLEVSKDKKRMVELGRKGGLAVSQDKEHMARIGKKGGKAKRRKRT